MKRPLGRGLFVAGCLLAGLASGEGWAASYQPLVGVAHVHSTASTGTLSLEEIATQAEASGIEAVLLTENFHLQFAYSLLPLPGLFDIQKSFPSLRRSTVAAYLATVDETNRRHPRVLLIPGVETVPFYYWTGSLWRGDLTMHDGQKNLLVVGLSRPEDFQGLPLIANPGAARYNARSLIRAAPLAFVLAGLGLLVVKRRRTVRIRGFQISERRRPWPLAVLLLAVGGAWSAYNAPFTVPAVAPSGPNAGAAAYKALIEYVDRHGGATIWSYPEAKDFHVHTYALTPRLATQFVTKTDPHPEVLRATDGYTAFGAIYRDATTAERPGQMWDQALEAYCLGRRKRPPWGLGELGFHGRHKRKALSDVLTIFYVRERTAEAVLEALGRGRMYAAIPERGVQLVVRTFALTSRGKEATLGEVLAVPPESPVTLRLVLEAHDGAARPFQAVLVRNGTPWRDLTGTTPFAITLDDIPAPGRACTSYRLWMRRPHRLITNPLFAAPSREINN